MYCSMACGRRRHEAHAASIVAWEPPPCKTGQHNARIHALACVLARAAWCGKGTQSRVVQFGMMADLLLKEAEAGGIVVGDMNTITPSDTTVAAQNGLLDA